MNGNKLQVAILTGAVLAGISVVQVAVPRLANDAGLLYLQAEYKLATGDTGSALKLMQRAVASRQKSPAPPAVRKPAPVQSCTYVQPHARRAATPPETRTAEVQLAQMYRDYFRLPMITVSALREEQALRGRAAWSKVDLKVFQQEKLTAAMRRLEARLKNVPVPPLPLPPASVESTGQVPLD
jgi:hypothetical protein